MTYLSQFPHAQLKPGAQIKPKPKFEPQLVRAYGPGLERTGLTVEDEAPFTIDCSQAGEGDVLVHLTAPSGHQLELHPQPVGNAQYNCTYLPQESGLYQIHVLFGGKEIPGSVFMA